MGYALTEAMQWDAQGWLTTVTLADYKIPGVLDSPVEIYPIVLEDPDPSHPVGAKGVGERRLTLSSPAPLAEFQAVPKFMLTSKALCAWANTGQNSNGR